MTSDHLTRKVVVVIGGSSGIGLEVARVAAAGGAKLIIVGRNAERLTSAKSALEAVGASVDVFQADAHDNEALEALFSALPDFDHLVSMVGDVNGGGFLKNDVATIRHVIESKFLTNVRIGQLAAGKIRDGGSLVFTSGTGGRAQDACGSYVGNLGINALVEGLAVELAPRVRVNAVSPTWTATPFWRNVPDEQVVSTQRHFDSVIPLKRTAAIAELAAAYTFLMANGFVTGQHIAVDGGIMLGG